MGATAHALGAATHESFTYDDEGNLLTPNFYDYHVPHALDMPPLKTGLHRVAVPVHVARHEGHGGGRRRRHPRRLRRAPGRAQGAREADRVRQLQPVPPRLGAPAGPGGLAGPRRGRVPMRVEGERTFAAPRDTVWLVLNSPERMAKTDAGRRELRHPGRPALDREREDPARARRAAHEDQLREDGGARARARRAGREGRGRRRDHEHADLVRSQRADGGARPR